jgi:hypothetical protein
LSHPPLFCREPGPRHLFGVTLASDFGFSVPLPVSDGALDLTFSVSPFAPLAGVRHRQAPVYTSPRRRPNGASACSLYRTSEYEILSFLEAEYYLWPDRIVCHLANPDGLHLVEPYLLGPVFAYWLERRGLPVLHASAVAVEGRAVVFAALHGTGKSGLAAALLHRGAALLGDDLAPLDEFGCVQPGFPCLRMWPDEAACFLRCYEHLPRVSPGSEKRWVPVGPDGFGTFCDRPLPLACLYLPERLPDRSAPVTIREIAPRDALIELVRHSFSPFLVEAVGLQPGRIDRFIRLLQQVPVRRLSYPSGFDRLPEVAEAVLRDLGC